MMKKRILTVVMAGALSSSLFGLDFDISLSGSKNGVDAFSFSVGEYYRVPQHEIVVVQKRLPKNDMSVAYFLSRRALKSIDYITALRMRGESWWDISINLGLNPHNIYVVQTQKRYGPPYGKAYGHDKHREDYRLSDDDIAELVNVKFLSNYHGVSADEIIEQRRRGERFINIDQRYHEQRAQRGNKKARREWREEDMEKRKDRKKSREWREDDRENKRDRREEKRGRDRE